MKQNRLLLRLRKGEPLTGGEQLLLIIQLSIPAILAQITEVVMEYIDSSMVGSLGASASASIGLVASSTWLFGGLLRACCTGFTVQAAQYIGAGQEEKARSIRHQGFVVCLCFSLLVAAIGAALSSPLPKLLGGGADITADAAWYFRIFALSAPVIEMVAFGAGMLQCSGNMVLPSALEILMCALDVLFNAFWIFPAGRIRKGEDRGLHAQDLKNAARIAVPVGIEQAIQSGAQIVSTTIVAPLGTVSIAANSLAVTAEALCYMPGYGIQTAASTMIGQSIGAGRMDLVRRLSSLTTFFGMAIQTLSGVVLYLEAPLMMATLSVDPAVQQLGTEVLRIEAFAEPWFAASIVAGGCFRGAGDTLVPSIMGLVSMWAVRLPLAALLTPSMGLHGVWLAMCIELHFRGILFLIRLAGRRWTRKGVIQGTGTGNAKEESGRAGSLLPALCQVDDDGDVAPELVLLQLHVLTVRDVGKTVVLLKLHGNPVLLLLNGGVDRLVDVLSGEDAAVQIREVPLVASVLMPGKDGRICNGHNEYLQLLC